MLVRLSSVTQTSNFTPRRRLAPTPGRWLGLSPALPVSVSPAVLLVRVTEDLFGHEDVSQPLPSDGVLKEEADSKPEQLVQILVARKPTAVLAYEAYVVALAISSLTSVLGMDGVRPRALALSRLITMAAFEV
jgi:hypothetical protein